MKQTRSILKLIQQTLLERILSLPSPKQRLVGNIGSNRLRGYHEFRLECADSYL